MKKNIGAVDKVLRIIIAAGITILFFTDVISGTLGIILMVVASVFVLVSFIGFCPLYLPCGLSTRKKK